MCALCFDRFQLEELSLGPGGKLEDVCLSCARTERWPLTVVEKVQ